MSGSGGAQREPTDTRLRVFRSGEKGPTIRQRSVGVSPGQFPGALEKSVFLQPHHHGNGRGSSLPSPGALLLVYILRVPLSVWLPLFPEPFVSSLIPRVVID